jgi:hypothetical protein
MKGKTTEQLKRSFIMTEYKPELSAAVRRGNEPVVHRLAALDKNQLHGVLATSSNDQPYTSMVAFALTPDQRGIVFVTPLKSVKFRNMLSNRRVALLIDNRSNSERDYLEAESVTLLGEAVPVRRGKRWNELAAVLAEKHPHLRGVIQSPQSRLIMVRINRCIHVTRFQTVSLWTPGENFT